MRTSLLVAGAAALAIAIVPAADAAKKKPIKPKAGTFAGTQTNSAGTTKTTGFVGKNGKSYEVRVMLNAKLKCSDGVEGPSGAGTLATIKKGKFSASQTVQDSRFGTATYKISGKFSSATAFKGTASKTT